MKTPVKYDCQGQGDSLYLQNLQKEVEHFLIDEGKGSRGRNNLLIPCVCHPFDADIAQNIFFETCSQNTATAASEIQSATTDNELFNDVVWGSSSSCCSQPAKQSGSTLKNITEQLIRFADIHFQSPATVTAMSQLDLGCLAVWLSWHPYLFSDEECNRSGSGDCSDDIHAHTQQWEWHQYRDNVVTGLLNVLGSQKHDPKCLSIAVSCLSFLIEQHTASDSVLTDANISQLLRLGLSKAVYPTIDPSGTATGEKSRVLAPQWEIAFSRTGLRRLLHIPQVLLSESAVNETFTFVSKWLSRLQVMIKY